MFTTIDKAGRLVIPKAMRDRVGLRAGPVEITVDGAALRLSPAEDEPDLAEKDGRLIIPAHGSAIDDDLVRALRDADRR